MSLNSNIKILIVEDSDFMQKLFIKYLQEKGYFNYVIANNGLEGLEILKNDSIDLIISDWNMPVKNGLDFLKELKKEEKYKNIPFVMATAQGEKEKQITALKEGANTHITKPFTSDQLQESIEEAFGLKKVKEIKIKERKIINGRIDLNIGHIQITDHIILGVLKNLIDRGIYKPKYFNLTTQMMPGWNPIQKSLETGDIDGAFVLAPIAMDLFAYEVPIKLIMLAHKNGSIFVRSKVYKPENSDDIKNVFENKIINIPHKLSVHNMLAHKYLSDLGLKPGVPDNNADINVTFEVIPPVQMPKTLMMTKDVAGFIVAEPIGTNAITKGIADLQFLSSNIWKDHPCCVVAIRDEVINKYPDAINELVSLLVDAGKFVAADKESSSEMGYIFLDPDKKLGLSTSILKKVLNDPDGITTNDLFPVIEDFDKLQRYMHDKMNIGQIIDLEKFIDLKFINEKLKD